MKNNVVCIFVDSVTWEAVGTTRAKVSATPFLDSLKAESFTATKLYSHGPYTDAAKTSLFTGRNCLDDYAYYFRENTSPVTDFKLFHEAGYETYCFSYPFWLYGKSIREHIDHIVYTAGFIFGSEWGSAFNYYYDLAQKSKLDETDYLLFTKRLSHFFYAFEKYLFDMRDKPESSILYGKCMEGFDLEDAINKLKIEKEEFEKSPREYIDVILKEGKNCKLSMIDTTLIKSIIDGNFLNKIYHQHKALFNKIKINNFRANIFSLLPSIKRVYWGLRRYVKYKDSSELIFLVNYLIALTPIHRMIKIWNNIGWQNDNTTHTILKGGIECLRKRKDPNRPFYMYLNTDDPHNYLSMFAYDTQNEDVVNDELKVLEEYVDKLGRKFKGNLLYFLSLRYVDYEIEKFCKELKKMGLWDTTTLMVVSDHGSSYTFYPLHNRRVNCFDDECYHIPVLIRHPGFKGIEVNTYQNSKDILPTLCDIVGIDKSPFFQGHSMLDPKRPQNDFVMTEYMGPGCPDVLKRRMWLSIRDNHYMIAYKVGVYELFNEGELCEVYDLIKDPKAYYNINDVIKRSDIQYLLNHLEERYEEVKKDAFAFVEDIRSNNI